MCRSYMSNCHIFFQEVGHLNDIKVKLWPNIEIVWQEFIQHAVLSVKSRNLPSTVGIYWVISSTHALDLLLAYGFPP